MTVDDIRKLADRCEAYDTAVALRVLADAVAPFVGDGSDRRLTKLPKQTRDALARLEAIKP